MLLMMSNQARVVTISHMKSDTDSNGSVIEFGPPTMKHPRVLNLITDSDEDVIVNNTQGSRKQKLRKTKKIDSP